MWDMTTATPAIGRSVAVSVLLVLSAACGATPPTPAPQASLGSTTPATTEALMTTPPTLAQPSPNRTPSATATLAATTTPGQTSTPSEATVTIELLATDGSGASGTLTATDNGDDTTTLSATLASIGLHPWALYPDFDCSGLPAEDTQLPVALPDIENGTSTETVGSSRFTQPVAAAVFEGPGGIDTIACGILPALPWAEAAPATPEPTTDPSVPAAIADLVDQMEAAVRDGDAPAYLALVDLGDPVFRVEHTRFVEDWAANPPTAYTLQVTDVEIDGDTATGLLTTTWDFVGIGERAAPLQARFTLGAGGMWRYAGEVWVTREIEHFRIHVAPGLEEQLEPISEALPEVFEHVTQSLDHEPDGVMEIKLFEGPAQLVSTVRLGLPDIHGWNEPGESLKVRLDPEVLSLTPTIAHEFGHFVEFDRAGTQRSRMPWWLSEGVASFLGYHFEGPERGEFQLQRVRDWEVADALADWEDMAVFEETPMEIWPNAYAQGYVFTVFVTETYGQEARNAWLAAMATEMDIDGATTAHLGITFDELEQEFLAWL
jgi:hypothetical protein